MLIILPGLLAALSLIALTINEKKNRKLFCGMPKIHTEKREKLCLKMAPFLGNSEPKNKYLAEKAGWDISGVALGYIRLMALLTCITLGGLIIHTNNSILRNEILANMSMGKSFIELQSTGMPSDEAVKAEIIKIKSLERQISKTTIKAGGAALLKIVSQNQEGLGAISEEQMGGENKRLALKLIKLHELKYSLKPWVGLALVSLLVYILPLPLGWIKGGLREQKRRDEIIRLYETMLLYGELPPYEIRALMGYMVNTSVIYKTILNTVLEGIKAGHCEKALEDTISAASKEKDWSFTDLLQHLKSFYVTGVLSKDKDLERVIDRKIKMEEINDEKKRNGKVQLATVPFGIIVGLGAWYFMLGTMSLSNLSILGK